MGPRVLAAFQSSGIVVFASPEKGRRREKLEATSSIPGANRHVIADRSA